MRFPNALEGVKKLYKAEIIGLISVIIGFVAAILALGGAVTASAGGSGGIGAVAIGGILIIVVSVLLIIAFIMNIIGLNKAKADEENFKHALTMVIVGIVASVVLGATKEGTILNSVGDNLSKICSLFVNYYVCTALISLAEKLGDAAVAQKAAKVRSLLMGVWVVSVVLNVLSDILQKNATLAIIAGVIALVAIIVEIVAYILYLGLLKRSSAMLEA